MKRTIALLLALVTVIGLLAGCAKAPVDPDPTPTPTPTPNNPNPTPDPTPDPTPVKPAEPYIYYYVRSSEETTLNPFDSNLTANLNVTDRCSGLLYWYEPGADGKSAPMVGALADGEPTVAADGLTWTIKLNKDAKWSDGEPINADTWLYSWKMTLNPYTYYSTGSGFASNYITIEGALDYYNSVAKNNGAKWEDVGIKKVDDYTIEVKATMKHTAEEVKRHFSQRSGACVYEPIYSKCLSADQTSCSYGTTLDQIKFAGQFYIESWVKGTEIIFVKNQYWPRADLIHIDRMISRVVTDESTRLELFEKGEASHIDLGANGMAKYGEDPRVVSYPTLYINNIEVNQNHSDSTLAPVLRDPDFRKALFWAIDRAALAKLTDMVVTPYFLSLQGQILDDGTKYRNTPEAIALVEKNAPNNGYDTAKAKQLLDSVLKKYNLTKLDISLAYTESSEDLRVISEYIAAQYAIIFEGKLNLELRAVASSARLTMMRESVKQPVATWELCWSSWGLGVERYTPWKKFEKYTSTNSTRYTTYSNDKVDELFLECLKDENRLVDTNLLKLTVEMEQAMYDDMTCVPVVGGQSFMLFQEYVQLPVTQYTPGLGMGWYYSSHK